MTESYRKLIVRDGDEICRITIDRPGDRNSLDTPLMKEIVR
ncbi:MAG: enoyl-CoA hydratase, partial [Deltaproteobacteria bacterium]|nr:enoyl-CoA hydratase [Deltaproteobacteria bacterium]MBW2102113.1 enoyl-CoA hydratase [Deltaproteobacteria bacterium]